MALTSPSVYTVQRRVPVLVHERTLPLEPPIAPYTLSSGPVTSPRTSLLDGYDHDSDCQVTGSSASMLSID